MKASLRSARFDLHQVRVVRVLHNNYDSPRIWRCLKCCIRLGCYKGCTSSPWHRANGNGWLLRLRMIDNAQNQQRWAATAAGLAFEGGRAKQIHVVGTGVKDAAGSTSAGGASQAHRCSPLSPEYQVQEAFRLLRCRYHGPDRGTGSLEPCASQDHGFRKSSPCKDLYEHSYLLSFLLHALSSFTCICAGCLVRVRTTLLTQTRILRAPACLSSEP